MTQWGLDTLFNPAKRHMDEEKRRLQSTREEAGDSSGGQRIDLEAGKVTIRRADSKDADGDAVAADDAAAKPKAEKETDAARRARLRRRAAQPKVATQAEPAAPEAADTSTDPTAEPTSTD